MDPSYPQSEVLNQVLNVLLEYKKEQEDILNELTSRVHDYLLGKRMIAFSLADYSYLDSAYDKAVNQINIEQCTNNSSYQFFGGQKGDNSTISVLPKEIVFHILELKSCSHILDVKPFLLSNESFKKAVDKIVYPTSKFAATDFLILQAPKNNFCPIL